MTPIEKRLRDNFPAIQMTLVSLIAALIFETLICKMLDYQGAWLVFGEHERLYIADPEASGKAGSHLFSRLLMLCAGIAIAGSATLLQIEVLRLRREKPHKAPQLYF